MHPLWGLLAVLVVGAVLIPVQRWRERSVRRSGDHAEADRLATANRWTLRGYAGLAVVAAVWLLVDALS
jgi:hypothetical protein